MELDFKEEIRLENERVLLVPLEMKHLELLMPISDQDPDLLLFSPSRFGSREFLREYFEVALNKRKAGERYPFVIYDKESSSYAGSTSFGNVSAEHRRLEIGWTWIGRRYQRTGLNRQCKYLLLQYAFEQLGYARVELKTDSRNVQSRNAMLGIGAKFEGELRSHTVLPDGYRRNTVYYSILNEEWPGLSREIFGVSINSID